MSRRTRRETQRQALRPQHSTTPVEGRRSGQPARTVERESHGFVSSWVDRAWWDPENELLEVQFDDGARVLYEKVTEAQWRAFKKAGSPGSFVRQELERHPFRTR